MYKGTHKFFRNYGQRGISVAGPGHLSGRPTRKKTGRKTSRLAKKLDAAARERREREMAAYLERTKNKPPEG